MINFKKFITELYIAESALSPAELLKDPSNLILQNYPEADDRGYVLYQKIKKGQPLTLNKGGEVKIKKGKNILSILKDKRYSEINSSGAMVSVDGDVLKLSDLKKTEEFGSSGGVGGGTAKTELFEAATTIVSAIFFKEKMKNGFECDGILSKLSKKNLKTLANKHKSNWEIEASLDSVIDFIYTEPKWRIGISYTAEAIYKELKPKSSSVFHRDTKKVSNMINLAMGYVKELGYKLQKDKWNPADIWMIDSSDKGYDDFMKQKSLKGCNNVLLKSLKKTHLVDGISLKLVGSSYPPVEKINFSQNDFDHISVDNIKVKIATGRLPMSKDVEIVDEDDGITLQARDFASKVGGAITGELLGDKARGGKVSLTVINDWLKSNGKKPIKVYSRDEIQKGKMLNKSFVTDMFKLILKLKRNKFIGNKSGLKEIKSEQDLKKLISKLKDTKNDVEVLKTLSSKIQGLQLASVISDELLGFAYSFASAKIEGISGPYIKIGK